MCAARRWAVLMRTFQLRNAVWPKAVMAPFAHLGVSLAATADDECRWSDCIHRLMFSRSVNDRLIDELAQQTPIPCARGTRRLRHQYGNEILGGIDPEVRARVARPIVVPGGPRECCDTIGDAHSKTQSECV